jgi:hypothetical protein
MLSKEKQRRDVHAAVLLFLLKIDQLSAVPLFLPKYKSPLSGRGSFSCVPFFLCLRICQPAVLLIQ